MGRTRTKRGKKIETEKPFTPILDALHGDLSISDPEQHQEKEEAILTVRKNLIERLDSIFEQRSPTTTTTSTRWPGVVFQGRDPEDRRTNLSLINSQGMSSALREAWEFNQNVVVIQKRLEDVLKLFARWNWDLFPEVQELEGYNRLWPGSYTSLLDVLRSEDGLVRQPVIGIDNAEEVAASVFKAVKSRVSRLAPQSHLLMLPDSLNRAPRAEQSGGYYIWKMRRSLATPRDGSSNDNFCGHLRSVILKQGADASTEACEAALELEVYRLAKRVMSAWSDQFPAVESTVASPRWRHSLQGGRVFAGLLFEGSVGMARGVGTRMCSHSEVIQGGSLVQTTGRERGMSWSKSQEVVPYSKRVIRSLHRLY